MKAAATVVDCHQVLSVILYKWNERKRRRSGCERGRVRGYDDGVKNQEGK